MLRSVLAPSSSQSNPAGLVDWEDVSQGVDCFWPGWGRGAVWRPQSRENIEEESVGLCWPLRASEGVNSCLCTEVPAGVYEG